MVLIFYHKPGYYAVKVQIQNNLGITKKMVKVRPWEKSLKVMEISEGWNSINPGLGGSVPV